MIVLDLEWNRSYDKIPLDEILQIGAVKIAALGGPILDTFCAFVHPKVHRKLNRTARALPELQSSLDSTLDFAGALAAFKDWCGPDDVFADWGGDDFAILRQNCEFFHLPVPGHTRLIDLQAAFSLRVGTHQGMSLAGAVEYCGIPTSFTFHNALNDAAYTAVLTAWIRPEDLALLELPKEVRRLVGTPPFPTQPWRPLGPYTSLRSALNSRSSRRQSCPFCREPVWVRQWYPMEPDTYCAFLRCKTHGDFLCKLSLSNTEIGQWQGRVTVPEITLPLLEQCSGAARNKSIPCKGGRPRKKFFRRPRRRERRS